VAETKIRWGVIGARGIADKRTIPEGIIPANNSELAAIMSRTDVRQLSEKYGGVPWFTDVGEMLDSVEMDACYIATPPHTHLEQVQACAERGVHVLCEKPLAISVKEAEQIRTVCEEAGVKLGIGFMMPFHHLSVEAKRIVDEGILGQVVSARAQLGFDYPPMEGAFRQVRELHRGGVFMDVGNHGAGLIEFVVGARVDAVMAMVENVVYDYEGVEDTATAILHLANRAIAVVDTSFGTAAAQNLLEINGAKRTLVAEGVLGQTSGGVLRVVENSNRKKEYLRIESDCRNMYQEEIEAFAEAIINDTNPPMDGAEGVWSQRVVEAAYQSAERGELVRVADV